MEPIDIVLPRIWRRNEVLMWKNCQIDLLTKA